MYIEKHGEKGLFTFQWDFAIQRLSKHNTADMSLVQSLSEDVQCMIFTSKRIAISISFLSLENLNHSPGLPVALGNSYTQMTVFYECEDVLQNSFH